MTARTALQVRKIFTRGGLLRMQTELSLDDLSALDRRFNNND